VTAPPRGDLDLGELLGDQVTHYREVLGGRDPMPVTPPVPAGQRQARGPEASAPTVYVPSVERFGEDLPDLASSCTELVVSPEICWDVCGYYAALRVPWTATRRELLEAYTALGGPDDEHLTYVLKQLLRDGGGLRRRYDRQPLGNLFREDKDVETYLLRLAIRVGRSKGVTQEEVLQGWGLAYQRRVRADEGQEGPGGKGISFDSGARHNASDPVTDSEWWLEDWGWYGLNLWQVPARAGEILAEWQRLLAAEFSARGMRIRFAVGLGPVTAEESGQTFHIGPNGSAIFFSHTEQPTPAMAIEAANGYSTALTSPQTGEPVHA
jgi:hypothetical protein